MMLQPLRSRSLEIARRSLRTHRPPTAALYTRLLFGCVFVCGAIVHVVLVSAAPQSYAPFADASPLAWITRTWRSIAAPNVEIFIPLLAAFELAVGVLILGKAWRAKAGLVAAFAFHVALTLFGLWPYSVPAGVVIVLLLRYDYGAAFGHIRVMRPGGLSRAA